MVRCGSAPGGWRELEWPLSGFYCNAFMSCQEKYLKMDKMDGSNLDNNNDNNALYL